MEKVYDEGVAVFGKSLFWLTILASIGLLYGGTTEDGIGWMAWEVLKFLGAVWVGFIALGVVINEKLKKT